MDFIDQLVQSVLHMLAYRSASMKLDEYQPEAGGRPGVNVVQALQLRGLAPVYRGGVGPRHRQVVPGILSSTCTAETSNYCVRWHGVGRRCAPLQICQVGPMQGFHQGVILQPLMPSHRLQLVGV